jgi:hypothetical protein
MRSFVMKALTSLLVFLSLSLPLSTLASERQGSFNGRVIVVFREGTKIRLPQVRTLLAGYNIQTVHRLFRHRSEEEIENKKPIDLNLFFEIPMEDPKRAAKLAADLSRLDLVAVAYPESRPILPTPDFEPLQGYIEPAPSGVDAAFVRAKPGGTGSGVTIVDIENGWTFDHEDLPLTAADLLSGSNAPDLANQYHGAAVVGVMAGLDNGLGVTGLAHGATIKVASWYGLSPAATIDAAASALAPGDILLLEGQVDGPNGACDFSSQEGCVPMEWEYANYAAILNATSAGITVIEAAGNGGEDLDNVIYGGAFDPTGRLLAPSGPPSGAVIVGAGDPATHARLGFSNYGSRVALQGWGSGIVTAGYGNLFNGGPLALYTNGFGGTSGAAPMVAAAFASLRGIASASGAAITDGQILEALISTGTPQTPAGDPKVIGPFPDLKAASKALFDPDGDDLFDIEEAVLGTDPGNADSDGDGLGDGYEVAAGLDPTVFNAPEISLEPASLDFGTVNRRGKMLHFVVRNGGNLPLQIFEAVSSDSEFSIGPVPSVIPVGGEARIPVVYSPGTAGSRTASIAFTTNDASTTAVLALSGEGEVSEMAASPEFLDFGPVSIREKASQSITLSNPGGNRPLKVTLSTDDPAFFPANLSADVPPGEAVQIPVSFRPYRYGRFEGRLLVRGFFANAQRIEIPLRGFGEGDSPEVVVKPDSIDLSDLAPGETTVREIKVSNPGAGRLYIHRVEVLKEEGSEVLPLLERFTVAPEGERVLKVRFRRSLKVSVNGSLRLIHNGPPGAGSVVIPFDGNGGKWFP